MGALKRPSIPAAMRHELQVVAAVAREALLHTHVAQALELIGLAHNRVSAMRMLSIYVRVNQLTAADADLVATRVLAMLGENTRGGARPAIYVEGEDDVAESLPVIGILRRRLRGRALDDLRRWVELHTGRTQVLLLEVHVVHALRFVALLEDTHSMAAALRVYIDALVVPRPLQDVLHYFALDRLAATGLPSGEHGKPVRLAGAAEPSAVSLSTRGRPKADNRRAAK